MPGIVVPGNAVRDGAPIDEAAVDEAAVDGAAVDGAAVDGAAVDGAAVDGAAVDEGAVEAAHHMELTGGWALWRLSALRRAGMPLSWLAPYALPADVWAGGGGSEEDARAAAAAAVRQTVAQPSFVEAVVWQNADLARNWLLRFAQDVQAGGAGRLSRRDQREVAVARLAQRYCAKNESIGFFGPVGWSRFVGHEGGVTTRGGAGLRRRDLFVEAWAADAIAATFSTDPRVAEHLIARRHPAVAVTDGLLVRPRRGPVRLEGDADHLVRALDRPRRVAELLDRCALADGPGSERTRLVAALESLRVEGVVVVGLPIPLDDRPDARLRRLVAGIPEPVLRAELVERLDRWDRRIDAIRAVAGDPALLLGALDDLEAEFAGLTHQSGRRHKGTGQYGRALVYEDCRADLDVTIGLDMLRCLREPLSVVLASARWFVAEVGAEVGRDLLARYRSLGPRAADGLSLCDLVLAAGDVLNGLPGTAVHRVVEDFTARWAELLATATGNPPTLRTSHLGPLVRALFPWRPVAWRAARQHSPDLLLRMVPSPDGPRPQWVLGELHLALNTLENRVFLTQADDRSELLTATAADFADGRIVPVFPKASAEVTSRTYPPPAMDVPDRFLYWSYALDDGHPSARSLPGAGLRVRERDGRLVAGPPDGVWQVDVREFLGEFLTAVVVNRFRIRPSAPHLPRLQLDDVVIERESWRFGVADIPLPDAADYHHRGLRRWLVERGMPRYLFVRTAGHGKPFLVDRDAPLLLRNFARVLRQERVADPAGRVDLVEMLPDPDEVWLVDGAGERYTSELRVVAFDETQSGDELPSGLPLPQDRGTANGLRGEARPGDGLTGNGEMGR